MPAQPFFSMTVGTTKYELAKLSLGDARTLKRQFGLDDLEDLNPTDPDQLVGLLYLAKCAAHPERDRGTLLEEVEGIDLAEVFASQPDAEPTPEVGPTPAGAEPADQAPPAGSPETTPKKRGSRS